MGFEKKKRPVGSAYLATPQTIPHYNLTTIVFDTQFYDTDGMFTPPDSKIYAKRLSGYYLVEGSACFNANATGYRAALLRLNGSYLTYIDEAAIAPSPQGETIVKVGKVYYLNVNDYVELQVSQYSGGNLDVLGPEDLTWLSIAHLSGR